MKKSLVAAMLCMTLSVGISTSAFATGQAPPGLAAAASNKDQIAGVKEVNNQQPVSGAIAATEGKAFALVPMGQGISKMLPVRLIGAGCADSKGQGGSSCITPALWRPAVDKIKAPPLIAGIFDQNYTGRAHLPETSFGEPPGAAVLI